MSDSTTTADGETTPATPPESTANRTATPGVRKRSQREDQIHHAVQVQNEDGSFRYISDPDDLVNEGLDEETLDRLRTRGDISGFHPESARGQKAKAAAETKTSSASKSASKSAAAKKPASKHHAAKKK